MNCANNTPIVGNLQTFGIKRGTTFALKAQRKDAEGNPILTEPKEIYFIVKKQWIDKTALITKDKNDMTFDEEGYYHFTITPEDTENLDYGTYVWDLTPVDDNNAYRQKPASGKLTIGNSSGWIVNETTE